MDATLTAKPNVCTTIHYIPYPASSQDAQAQVLLKGSAGMSGRCAEVRGRMGEDWLGDKDSNLDMQIQSMYVMSPKTLLFTL